MPGPNVQVGADTDLREYARQAAIRAGVDPDIYVRQIDQESGFNPNAYNPSGATGIAQIVPKFHPGVNANDPIASLDYGANLMASHLKRYNGDYSKALAAYNAGPGNVDQYDGIPPFAETQKYVSNILGLMPRGGGHAVPPIPAYQPNSQNLQQSLATLPEPDTTLPVDSGPTPIKPTVQQVFDESSRNAAAQAMNQAALASSTVAPALPPSGPTLVKAPSTMQEAEAAQAEYDQAGLRSTLSTLKDVGKRTADVYRQATTRQPDKKLPEEWEQILATTSLDEVKRQAAAAAKQDLTAQRAVQATIRDGNSPALVQQMRAYQQQTAGRAQLWSMLADEANRRNTPLPSSLRDVQAYDEALDQETNKVAPALAQGQAPILGAAAGAVAGAIVGGPVGILPGGMLGLTAVGQTENELQQRGVIPPNEMADGNAGPTEGALGGLASMGFAGGIFDPGSKLDTAQNALMMTPMGVEVAVGRNLPRLVKWPLRLGIEGLSNYNVTEVSPAVRGARELGQLLTPEEVIAVTRRNFEGARTPEELDNAILQSRRAEAGASVLPVSPEQQAVAQAVEDWRQNRLYVDAQGNYRQRSIDRNGQVVLQPGPVAPYNDALRAERVTPDMLDDLAKQGMGQPAPATLLQAEPVASIPTGSPSAISPATSLEALRQQRREADSSIQVAETIQRERGFSVYDQASPHAVELAAAGGTPATPELEGLYRRRDQVGQAIQQRAISALGARLPSRGPIPQDQVLGAVRQLAQEEPAVAGLLDGTYKAADTETLNIVGQHLARRLVGEAPLSGDQALKVANQIDGVVRALTGEDMSGDFIHSRLDFEEQVRSAFPSYTDTQIEHHLGLADRFARFWARANGIADPQAWYRRNNLRILQDRASGAAALMQLDQNPGPVFFHASERALNSIRGGRATVQQIRSALSPKNGVKPDELKWTTMGAWLDEQEGALGKDGLLSVQAVRDALMEREQFRAATMDVLPVGEDATGERQIGSLEGLAPEAVSASVRRAVEQGMDMLVVPPELTDAAEQVARTWDMTLRQGENGQQFLDINQPMRQSVLQNGVNLWQRDLANAGPPNDTPYVSTLGKALDALAVNFPRGMTVDQAVARLSSSKVPGLKAAEMAFTGMDEWLAAAKVERGGNGRVTAEEMRQAFAQKQVQLQEVMLGEPLQWEWRPRTDLENTTAWSIYDQHGRETYEAEATMHGSVQIWPTGEDGGVVQYYNSLTEAQQGLAMKGMDPKYRQYMLPGTTNYRELLIKFNPPNGEYQVPHFGEEGNNLLAHTLMSDRFTLEGEHLLNAEEAQSDWLQAAMKQGFRPTELPAGYREQQRSPTRWIVTDERQPGNPQIVGEGRTVEGARSDAFKYMAPQAPFVDTWQELLVRRLLYQASLEGYEAMSWSDGRSQVQKYGTNLAVWRPAGDGKFEIDLRPKIEAEMAYTDRSVAEWWNWRKGTGEGSYWNNGKTAPGTMVSSLDELKSKITSEFVSSGDQTEIDRMAARLWAKMQASPEGVWMPRKEGMEQAYDREMTGYGQKLAKKFGIAVQDRQVVTKPGKVEAYIEFTDGTRGYAYGDENSARQYLEDQQYLAQGDPTMDQRWLTATVGTDQAPPETMIVHAIPVTPEMRAAVLRDGVTLFQKPAEYDGRRLEQFRQNIEKPSGLIAELRKADLWSAEDVAQWLGHDRPEYLNATIRYMNDTRQRLLAGEITPREVAKAWVMTIMSQQATEVHPTRETPKRPGGMAGIMAPLQPGSRVPEGMRAEWDAGKIPETFNSYVWQDGSPRIRPEEAGAMWLLSSEGERALDNLESGNYSRQDWYGLERVRAAYGSPQFHSLNVMGDRGPNGMMLQNVEEVTKGINEAGKLAASTGSTAALQEAVGKMNGVGPAKNPFVRFLLGFGDDLTIDAVETNLWIVGKTATERGRSVSNPNVKSPDMELAARVKDMMSQNPPLARAFKEMIDERITTLKDILGVSDPASPNYMDPAIASHVLHHWLWDTAKRMETSHDGMYLAMKLAQEDAAAQGARGAVTFTDDSKAVIRAFQAASDNPEGGANITTLAHELGHVWRRDLPDALLQRAAQWAGATDPYNWPVAAEERFARGLERYLREGWGGDQGEAVEFFDNFKQWFTDVYRYVRNSPIDVNLSPDMKSLYDEMLGVREQDPHAAAAGDTLGQAVPRGGQQERGFTDTLRGAEATSPYLQGLIDQDGRFKYEKITNQDTWVQANNVLDTNPVEASATLRMLDRNPEAVDARGVAVGFARMIRAQAEAAEHMAAGRKEQATALYDEAANLAAGTATALTKAGQVVQAAAMWQRLSPQGVLRFAAQFVQRSKTGEPTIRLAVSSEQADALVAAIQREGGSGFSPEHALRLINDVQRGGGASLTGHQAKDIALRVARQVSEFFGGKADPALSVSFERGGKTFSAQFQSEAEKLQYELYLLTQETGKPTRPPLLQADDHADGPLQRLVDRFGVADGLDRNGFLLPDGRLVDITKQKITHERAIFEVRRGNDENYSPLGYLLDPFLDETGTIRLAKFGSTLNVQFSHNPSQQQMRELAKLAKEYTQVVISSSQSGAGGAMLQPREVGPWLARFRDQNPLYQADAAPMGDDRMAEILARLQALGIDEATARKEGKAIFDNVQRRAATAGEDVAPRGRKAANYTTATGADPNKPYEFRFRVMPLDEVVASHVNPRNPSPNPAYTAPGLQPRDRSAMASREQILSGARQLQPDDLLYDTRTLDRGPMIVGPDRLVESGNGRTLMLQLARDQFPERWQAYQAALSDEETLARAGLSRRDLQGIQDPVLVRERVTPLDEGQRANFALEANAPTVLGSSLVENAAADTRLINDEALGRLQIGEEQGINEALQSSDNKTLVDDFLAGLGNEGARLRDPEGGLTRNGLERLQAALFAKVFGVGETGTRLIRTFFESPDPTIANVRKGVLAGLGDLAHLEGRVRSGAADPGLSLADDLSKATDMLARLRLKGQSAARYVEQGQLFGRELTPLQEQLLVHLEAAGRSPRLVKEFITGYAARAADAPPPGQAGLFGDMLGDLGGGPTKEGILDAVMRDQGIRGDMLTLGERQAAAEAKRLQAAEIKAQEQAARDAVRAAREAERQAKAEAARLVRQREQAQRSAQRNQDRAFQATAQSALRDADAAARQAEREAAGAERARVRAEADWNTKAERWRQYQDVEADRYAAEANANAARVQKSVTSLAAQREKSYREAQAALDRQRDSAIQDAGERLRVQQERTVRRAAESLERQKRREVDPNLIAAREAAAAEAEGAKAVKVAMATARKNAKADLEARGAFKVNALTPEQAKKFVDKAIADTSGSMGDVLTPEVQQSLLDRSAKLQGLEPGSREQFVETALLLRDVEELAPATRSAKASALVAMAQLGNLITVNRNLAGNAGFLIAENTAQFLGAALDIARVGLVGGNRETAMPNIRGQMTGFWKGGKEGLEEAVKGITISALPGQVERGGGARTFRTSIGDVMAPNLQVHERVGRALDTLPHYAEILLNIGLRATDKAFYQAAVDGAVPEFAFIEAQRAGYKGQQLSQKTAEGIVKPSAWVAEQAHARGLYRTFQNDTTLAAAAVALKGVMNWAGTGDMVAQSFAIPFGQKTWRGSFYTHQFGVGNFVLNYPRIPANLIMAAVDYSPVAFLQMAPDAVMALSDWAHGRSNQQDLSMRLSRGLVGTFGLTGAGFLLGSVGIISGGPSVDPAERQAERDSGIRPYSVNVSALWRALSGGFNFSPDVTAKKAGDTFITYDWAVPLSTSVALGAELAKPVQKKTKAAGRLDLGSMGDLFAQIPGALQAGGDAALVGMNFYSEQGILRTVRNFTSSRGSEVALLEVLKSAPASMVPAILYQMTKLLDNTVYETREQRRGGFVDATAGEFDEAVNTLLAKLPGGFAFFGGAPGAPVGFSAERALAGGGGGALQRGQAGLVGGALAGAVIGGAAAGPYGVPAGLAAGAAGGLGLGAGANPMSPSYGTWSGKTQQRYQEGTNNFWNVFVNPAFISQYRPTEGAWLDALKEQGAPNSQYPRPVPRDIQAKDLNGDLRTWPLTAAERSTLGEKLSNANSQVFGDLYNSPEFKAATPAGQRDLIRIKTGEIGKLFEGWLQATSAERQAGTGVSPLAESVRQASAWNQDWDGRVRAGQKSKIQWREEHAKVSAGMREAFMQEAERRFPGAAVAADTAFNKLVLSELAQTTDREARRNLLVQAVQSIPTPQTDSGFVNPDTGYPIFEPDNNAYFQARDSFMSSLSQADRDLYREGILQGMTQTGREWLAAQDTLQPYWQGAKDEAIKRLPGLQPMLDEWSQIKDLSQSDPRRVQFDARWKYNPPGRATSSWTQYQEVVSTIRKNLRFQTDQSGQRSLNKTLEEWYNVTPIAKLK